MRGGGWKTEPKTELTSHPTESLQCSSDLLEGQQSFQVGPELPSRELLLQGNGVKPLDCAN